MKEKLIKTPNGKMFIRIDHEKRSKTLLFLHGWGMSSATFDNLVPSLSNYRIIRVDFLGFGKSESPQIELHLDDYVDMLQTVIKRYFGNKNGYIIAHSFGARVAIKYLTSIPKNETKVEKLFLINGKALASKSLNKRLKIIKYKIKKLIYSFTNQQKYQQLITTSGSSDYQRLNGVMKKTFTNIVNHNLKRKLKKVKTKTIIMGSVNDDVVPYKETLVIYKHIKNSVLYTFYSSKHFSYLDEEKKVLSIIRKEVNK